MVDLVVDCLSHDSSLEKLKGVWQTLERLDAQCTPFSSWVWADNWWREFRPKNSNLSFLIVRNGQEVVGICPLYRQTINRFHILPVTTLALLGAMPGIQTTHPFVIAHPRIRKLVEIAVMRYLPKLTGWHTLELDGVEADSSVAAVARVCLKTRRGYAADELLNDIEQERLLCSWDDYRAKGSGQRALELNQLCKTVKGLGVRSDSYELSICSTRQDLNESQDVFYSLGQGTAVEGSKLKSNAAAQERFYRSIVSEFFVADLLWQISLKIDGETVGVQHYFIWRGDLLLFQDAYSAKLKQFDVARFMLAYAIKRGIGQAFNRVRIQSESSDQANSLVSEYFSSLQLRFTPSIIRRALEKR